MQRAVITNSLDPYLPNPDNPVSSGFAGLAINHTAAADNIRTMIDYLFIPIAYLLGSFSSAIVVCRVMGCRPHEPWAQNNPGATNVLRIGVKKQRR